MKENIIVSISIQTNDPTREFNKNLLNKFPFQEWIFYLVANQSLYTTDVNKSN